MGYQNVLAAECLWNNMAEGASNSEDELGKFPEQGEGIPGFAWNWPS